MRNEPVGVGGQPGRGVADEPRQRHDAIGGDQPAVGQRGPVVAQRYHLGIGQQANAAVGEQVADDPAGGGAEKRQRLALGGGEGQLGADHAMVGDPCGGQQRQLVERQRPARRGRDREKHVVDGPRFQLGQQHTVVLDVLGSPERQRARQPLRRERAGGDHERVELQFAATGQRDAMGVAIHARERVAPVTHAMGALKPIQRQPIRRRVAEGLHHRQRPIQEMVLGRYELDLDRERLGQRPQREHRLDRTHAVAGHDDPRTGSHRWVPFGHDASLVADRRAIAVTRTGHARGLLNGWQSPFDRPRTGGRRTGCRRPAQ